MEILTLFHYLFSIYFCTCWHSDLKSFQVSKSLTKKKVKSSVAVPYLCIVNLVSKDPRAMNHSGHRRWALCNCECWTCEACWHWNAGIPLAEKGQHSIFHFNLFLFNQCMLRPCCIWNHTEFKWYEIDLCSDDDHHIKYTPEFFSLLYLGKRGGRAAVVQEIKTKVYFLVLLGTTNT